MYKFLIYFIVFLFIASPAQASYDPLSVANNRIGVHILDVQELLEASKLINSSGGEWGYVTIPIQSNDRDAVKWSAFFKRAAELHIIPIIRLATYVDGDKWVTPTAYDLVDFANFLTPMPWPTENRYIIIFNEPNHANEWGGKVNPAEYAALLVQAKAIFKSRSQDFFIITAGLDMSAPTNHTSMDALNFFRAMSRSVPIWSVSVDGFSFHSYPNPGFQAPYTSKTRYGPQSYRHELAALKNLGITPASWFITETGTLRVSDFYKNVFTEIWTEPNIVAITPFLLFAGSGAFTGFSLLDMAHQPTPNYQEIFTLSKISGSPLLNIEVLAGITHLPSPPSPINRSPRTLTSLLQDIRTLIFRPAPTLSLGNTTLTVEIMDTDSARQKGLSGRNPLPDNHGMFFIFPKASQLKFHMKDMKFGLDMIWIRDNKVVEITQSVPPPSQTQGIPQVVSPQELADSILEVPAGFAKDHAIQIGDFSQLSP